MNMIYINLGTQYMLLGYIGYIIREDYQYDINAILISRACGFLFIIIKLYNSILYIYIVILYIIYHVENIFSNSITITLYHSFISLIINTYIFIILIIK